MTFNKPNLTGPRYRYKILTLLNTKMFNEFKDKYPAYADIDNKKLKLIIKLYNEALWKGVIDNRDGVELPESLGYLFIGSFDKHKKINVDYKLSIEYGKLLQLKNWDTDGHICKIVYTNWSAKYKFKNRELWGFTAGREFKRTVAKEYPKQWTKYLKMKAKTKVSQLYIKNNDNNR